MGNSETIWDSEDIRKNRMQTVKSYHLITSLHDILMTGYVGGGRKIENIFKENPKQHKLPLCAITL